jgi:hypothetical protein
MERLKEQGRRFLVWPIRWVLGRRRPLKRSAVSACVSDLRTFSFEPVGELEVYWLDTSVAPVGQSTPSSGPAASWYMNGREILRFDCLAQAAHMHINLQQSAFLAYPGAARIFFEPGTVQQHIDRAVFELQVNLRSYALPMTTRLMKRPPTLPSDVLLAKACAMLREQMLDLVRRHATVD